MIVLGSIFCIRDKISSDGVYILGSDCEKTLNEEVIIFVFFPVWLITVAQIPRKCLSGVKLRFLGETLGGPLYSVGRKRTSVMQD